MGNKPPTQGNKALLGDYIICPCGKYVATYRFLDLRTYPQVFACPECIKKELIGQCLHYPEGFREYNSTF